MPESKSPLFYLFLTLLFLDLVFLAIHGWNVYLNLQADSYALEAYLHPFKSILAAFNADGEGTVIAWFSSTKLFLIGIISIAIARGLRVKWIIHPCWALIGLLFIALSADETASLHETLAGALMQLSFFDQNYSGMVAGDDFKNSFLWVIIFAPIGAAIFSWLIWSFYKHLKPYPNALFACLAAIGFFVLAMSMEATVFLAPPVTEWRSSGFIYFYKLLTSIEEFFELMGMNCLVYGLGYFLFRLLHKQPHTFVVKG